MKADDRQNKSPYLDLRSMALSMRGDQFGLEDSGPLPIAYGVVMDWNVGEGIVTFVSFSNGDASMYTSTGGGVIGGIGHEAVRNAAKNLVQKAQAFLPKARKSQDTNTAGENEIRFFILTTQGRFVADEKLKNLDNEASEWLELFIEANKVITELRNVSEGQQE